MDPTFPQFEVNPAQRPKPPKPTPPKLPADAYTLTKEFKIVCMRECPIMEKQLTVDNPDNVEAYLRTVITTDPRYNPETESFFVLLVNTRRKVKGYAIIATGTLDTLLVHPREAFRVACIVGAAAVVLVHNHPSGDPTPSEADVKVTRDLIRAGQVLKIEVLDHVVIGQLGATQPRSSLRELGYFYS